MNFLLLFLCKLDSFIVIEVPRPEVVYFADHGLQLLLFFFLIYVSSIQFFDFLIGVTEISASLRSVISVVSHA